MDRKTQQRFDRLYRNTPLDEIPWNYEEPPELLVELLDSGRVKPCRTLDLGCGAGNYAIYLASKGFDVTAIDISTEAIKIAKQNAKAKNVKCTFLVADVTENLPHFGKPFDFIYDWGLLHHVPPEKRTAYTQNVHRILTAKGLYLSLCFNQKDTAFEGTGKVRQSNRGTTIYLSSESDLKQLWTPFFNILDFRVLCIEGKTIAHTFNFALLKKY